MKPGVADIAGGAGFQLVQTAKGLQDCGYPVSFVTGDFGQEDHVEIDGFDVFKSNRVAHDRSLTRGIKNLWRLFSAMRKAKANHYILRSTRFLSFFVMLYAKLLGAKYTFMVANLPHCLRKELESLSPVFRHLYGISLKYADRITTQTQEQQDLFLENFRILAPIVPNGIEVPPFSGRRLDPPYDINWVGSFKVQKRPDLLIDFAELLPHRKFVVAGGPGSDAVYSSKWMTELENLENVNFLGFVSPDQVAEVYGDAKLHLSTSDWEGFPNAFLYSWTKGVPTCALKIDPDFAVSRGNLGLVDPHLGTLAEKMDKLLEDEEQLATMSHLCHAHVMARHSRDASVKAFLKAVIG